MSKTMVLVDRDVFFDELRTVFDSRTTETLLLVLDRVAAQTLAASVPREDFIDLRRLVAELIEAQKETERRWQLLEAEMAELVAEHRQFMRVQERLVADVETLKTDVAELKTDMVQVKVDIRGLKNDVGTLKGDSLETKYRLKAANYFGRLLRRPKVVDMNHIVDQLEAHLTDEEFDGVLLADLIVQGKPRLQTEKGDVWLVLEISAVVDINDVMRARQRANFLRKAGFQSIPVAAGEELTQGAETEAHRQNVVILQHGRYFGWHEALSAL